MSENVTYKFTQKKDFCAVTQCLKHVNITFLFSAHLWSCDQAAVLFSAV